MIFIYKVKGINKEIAIITRNAGEELRLIEANTFDARVNNGLEHEKKFVAIEGVEPGILQKVVALAFQVGTDPEKAFGILDVAVRGAADSAGIF